MKYRVLYLLPLLVALPVIADEPGFTEAQVNDLKTFLHNNFGETNVGMVVGLLDKNGSRVFSAGKLDNGTGQKVNGDTIFEIGSVTKTFTSLLALEMEQRGEIKLNDPVAKYLPKSVKVPSCGGKEITLLNLAAQDSGLPFNPDNLPKVQGSESPWADYSVEKIYEFLSAYTLTNEPGTKFQYSNFGMGLLGHVMALKAGTNFEALVANRICRPLQMDSTGITLSPELKARLARGHDAQGKPAPNWELPTMPGAGALRSTANDLLKYVSANLGLKRSRLTPLMERAHVIRHTGSPEHGTTAMPWMDEGVYQPPGMELLGHAGGTGAYSAFIGFDKKHRRGVVVLSNQQGGTRSGSVGWRILQGAPLAGRKPIVAMQEFVGSGISIDLDKPNHGLRIIKVHPNTSAAKAGLTEGLIIQKIDGVSIEGKSVAECAAILRGAPGTKVRLELVSPERKETNTVELVRQTFMVGR